ncbi:YceH family protein [Thiocapsa sp.]|uniref:YceH family protein n=1 Tax=Thiocapsa sp. TaxID=2024551 RepID=UPI003593FE7C
MPIEHASETSDAMLTQAEARVLGCLMEKQRTTPDQYPLTLNSLVSACNQKSARHPVMNMTQGEVGHVVNQLRDRGLVYASLSGRTERYDHKIVGTFLLSREEQALLCAMMLRGPQTTGELRTNTARLADFKDLEQVTRILRGMAERDRPLVVELPRQPGKREERFAHLLCGRPKIEEMAESVPSGSGEPSRNVRIEALEAEVAELRAEIDRLWSLTGLEDQR